MSNAHPRINIDPNVCHGKPVISGTRVMVQQILASLASGETIDEVVKDYPSISHSDVLAALSFASDLASFADVTREAA